MGKNYFTEKQQEELRANLYIKNISEKAITYTQEFREKFSMEYQSGKLPSCILREMGIDPQIIGLKRKNSIVQRTKQYELRNDGFEDARAKGAGRPTTKNLTDAEKLKRLEQKVEYLKQENEFLKKNIQLDRQAMWEYNRYHPKDTSSSKQ